MPDQPHRGKAKTIQNALWGVANINQAVPVAQVQNQFLIIPQPVSNIRDHQEGGGSTAYTGDYYEITADSGVDHSFETARIGVYRPGTLSTAGVKYRLPTSTPEDTFEAGLGRSDDGGGSTVSRNGDEIFIRHDSDGSISFVNRFQGIETVVPQETWANDVTGEVIDDENGDPSVRVWGHDAMDSEAPDRRENRSGISLDAADGVLALIKYGWYGRGPIVLQVAGYGADGNFRVFEAVTLEPIKRTPISQPNQPIFARVMNSGGSSQQKAFVAGRQYSSEGGDVGQSGDNIRSTSHLRRGFTIASRTGNTAQATDTVALLFRRKPNTADAGTNYSGVELGIQEVQMFLDQRSYVYVPIDPDLGASPTWERPSGRNFDDETALQVATDGDPDPTTGTIYNGTIYGSGKNDDTLAEGGSIRFPVPRTKPVGLFAFSLTGTDETSAELNVKFAETR